MESGLSDDQAGLFSDAFGPDALSFSCRKHRGGWELFWTFDEGIKPDSGDLLERLKIYGRALEVDAGAIAAPVIESMEDRNWLAESYQALAPIVAGRFFIHGSHFQGDVPDGMIPLEIEAATAFGSGEHGTTSACMLALEHLHDSGITPENILDMGCGSGILAAAAARLWPDTPVTAADNDPECVTVTRRHLDVNGIGSVETLESDGYAAASPVWKKAPFDLVIANILAGPLIDMADDQSRAVAPGGHLILSGTLREQAERLFAAYRPHGFTISAEFPVGEWMTLLLVKD